MLNITKKVFAISLTAVLLSSTALAVLAEDDPGATLSEEGVTISPEDLGIDMPKLLPDSKFYFLKEWARGIRSFFTFNKVKKASLQLQFASEKLVETQLLALRSKGANAVKNAVQKYQGSLQKVERAVDKIKANVNPGPEANKFMEKFDKHRELHLGILDKLESQVPTSTMARIRQTRELHLQKFEGVMLKLEEKFQLRSQEKVKQATTTNEQEENENAATTNATTTGQKQQGQTKWIRLDAIEVVGEPVE